MERIWKAWGKLIIVFIISLLGFIYVSSKYLVEQTNVYSSPQPTVYLDAKTQSLSPSLNEDLVNQIELGHFSYKEANNKDLIIVGSYAQQDLQRFEKLNTDAALSLMKMIYAARDEDVWIIPVSGFRNITDQAKLFENQVQRRGSEEEAAKISAPPGYSEHHTGYAVDLGDGHFPKQDITLEFQETTAFQWLSKYAKDYGFEMSFPKNNSQGVSYEPWHWRFIGTQQAKAIFAKALKYQ